MSFPSQPAAIARLISAPPENVITCWPVIETCLEALSIASPASCIGALATVRVECPPFKPIHEFGKRAYFKRYDNRPDLGNTHEGDGYIYRGAGFIQITGEKNFERYGKLLGIDMIDDPNDPTDNADPDKALDVNVSASILAAYWRDHNCALLCEAGDWAHVRRAVNGGLNGFADFMRYVNILKGACHV